MKTDGKTLIYDVKIDHFFLLQSNFFQIQRVEQEELKNREANMAAQLALGGLFIFVLTFSNVLPIIYEVSLRIKLYFVYLSEHFLEQYNFG